MDRDKECVIEIDLSDYYDGPYITKIEIENFKSFYKTQKIPFAIPNGKIGSGLTLIVGEPNAGKSTVIDTVRQLYGYGMLHSEEKEFVKHPYRRSKIRVFVVEFEHGHRSQEVREVMLTSNKYPLFRTLKGELFSGANFPVGCHIDILGTENRLWSSDLGSVEEIGNKKEYEKYAFFFDNRRYKWDHVYDFEWIFEEYFGEIILSIDVDHSFKKNFNQIMRKIIPFNDWYVEKKKRRYCVMYRTESGRAHPFDLMGSGTRSLFKIVTTVLFSGGHFVMIDEPEMHLHNKNVEENLLKFLAQKAKKIPIVLITQSPHFIDWNHLANGAHLVRVHNKENQSFASTLSQNTIRKLLKIKDTKWHQPFLLDVLSKEIFFSNNIVFVEGQEDKALIDHFIKEQGLICNFNIFGYGSGGVWNIHDLLEAALELGIEAAAIFDGDREGIRQYMRCRKRFGRKALLIKLSTEDIIDDKNRQKEGLFFRNKGIPELKSKKKRELLQIITKINSYFKN